MHRGLPDPETTSLVLPQKASGGSWSSPTDTVSGIQISAQTPTMLQGSSKTLTAAVQPLDGHRPDRHLDFRRPGDCRRG